MKNKHIYWFYIRGKGWDKYKTLNLPTMHVYDIFTHENTDIS